MDHLSKKTQSQSRAQPRKFQYFTGQTTTNNLTASSIDQHRNSIEQRIANLESKLAKKFNPEVELSTLPHPQSDNYVNTRRMYQYSGVSTQNNKNPTPSNPQINTHHGYKPQSSSSGYSHLKQGATATKGESTFNYLGKFDKSMDEMALREKSKFGWESNNISYKQQKNTVATQSRDKLKAVLDKSSDRGISHNQNPLSNQTKEKIVGKKIKNVADSRSQNTRHQEQRKHQSSQKLTHKYPLSHYQPQPQKSTIPLSNPILNPRYFQQLNQLSTNISNLKQGGSYPFQNYNNPTTLQSRTISYDTGINLRGDPQKNNQLYEMMKSIMVGQERLQRELMMLKGSKMQKGKVSLEEQNVRYLEEIKQKKGEREKFFSVGGKKNKKSNVPDSRIMSPIHVRQEQKSSQKPQGNIYRSPQTSNNRKSVSPQTHKSKSPAQNKSSNPTLSINRKRANSAVMGKKLPGKIQKNKQRFDELYKQAQINKRLNQATFRITVSNQVVSSVWEKIKQSIKRAESEDAETSVIYHENNRWVNDHLVSKIELQKKLKNDLVKKVYEMVENKCLFK